MEFREARSLAALVRLGSLARAAADVNLTTAAVHKQIKNLEREFGVRLYEKRGRNLELTPAAHLITPYLDEMLAQQEAIAMALTEWKGLKRGVVRIGANPAVSSYLIPQLLRKFRRRWPEVTPVLHVGSSPEILERLAARSLDLFVGHWDEPAPGNLVTRAIWEYDVALVTSMKEVPPRVSLKELSQYPFVRLPAEGSLGRAVESYWRAHGLQPVETTVVNNSHTIGSMIRAGLGIAMLPMWAAADDVKTGAIRVIRQKEPALTARMGLLTARSGYVAPPVEAFLDMARRRPWRHVRLAPELS